MPWFPRRRGAHPRPHHNHQFDEPTNAIGWVRRLFQPPPAPTVDEDNDHHHSDATYTLTTPAAHDTFDFVATVRLDWCVTGRRTRLDAEIGGERENVRRQVAEIVRARAREHPPFRPAEAERGVRAALETAFARPVHECDEVVVSCAPHVEVGLGQQVREHQRKLGEQLLVVEAEAEVTRLRVERLAELRDLWSRFLGEGSTDWRTRFAVKLAEHPHDVHQVMDDMLDERRGEAVRLMNMVGTIVNAQETANVYDLVVGSESVLRKTLELMGVATPPLGDSPFELTDSVTSDLS
jgi:hypothetical protein